MSDIEKQLAAIRYTADRTKRYNEHGFTLLRLGIRGVVYFNTREDVADALTGLMDFYYEWAKDKLRPLQNSFSPNSQNPNTGFRLFSPQITPNFTQIPP